MWPKGKIQPFHFTVLSCIPLHMFQCNSSCPYCSLSCLQNGQTPFLLACEAGHEETIKFILKCKASLVYTEDAVSVSLYVFAVWTNLCIVVRNEPIQGNWCLFLFILTNPWCRACARDFEMQMIQWGLFKSIQQNYVSHLLRLLAINCSG